MLLNNLLLHFNKFQVKTSKMHLYTIIQLIILAALWAVKSTKGSLGFPFLLILCIPFRKFILPFIFKKEELHQVYMCINIWY